MPCDGVACNFAHVRWSSYQTNDAYSDVVVHEAAHMLHCLKPRHYGLHVGRHQERFVDVEFRHYELFAFAREAYSRVVRHGGRRSRISFAAQMPEGAFSLPRNGRTGCTGSQGSSCSEWLAGNTRGNGHPEDPKTCQRPHKF